MSKRSVLKKGALYGSSLSFVTCDCFAFFKRKNGLGLLYFLGGFCFDSLDFYSSYDCKFRTKSMKNHLRFYKERNLNLVAIVILCFSMGFGFFVEFCEGQTPCILCFLQRIIIMGMAISLYLNLLIGVKARHYGFALIWSLAGLACSLRHMAINICKEVPFGAYLFGPYRLYTWSFLLFFFSIFALALLLCIDKKTWIFPKKQKKDGVVYIAATLLLLMLGTGFFSALNNCGWGF